jgi:hypothetical protein
MELVLKQKTIKDGGDGSIVYHLDYDQVSWKIDTPSQCASTY